MIVTGAVRSWASAMARLSVVISPVRLAAMTAWVLVPSGMICSTEGKVPSFSLDVRYPVFSGKTTALSASEIMSTSRLALNGGEKRI